MYKIKFLDGTEKEFDTLTGANLWGADLSETDLVRANLRGADLRGANLRGANLEGTDLSYCTNIIGFYLGKHFGFMVIDSQYVKIGCEGHQLDFWLENYKKMGEYNNYNLNMIKRYGLQLNILKEMVDGQ